MIKTIALAAVASLAMLASAHAFDLNFGGSAGAGFNAGGTANWSGAETGSYSFRNGNANASAGSEAYGISEGTFGGDYSGIGVQDGNGALANSEWRLAGQNTAASGSLSNAAASSSGNGAAFSSTHGSGYGAGVSGGLGGAGSISFGN